MVEWSEPALGNGTRGVVDGNQQMEDKERRREDARLGGGLYKGVCREEVASRGKAGELCVRL